MKRILVTGGTGFIGSALVQTLLKMGYIVMVPTRDLRKGRRIFDIPNDILHPHRRMKGWKVPEKGSLSLFQADLRKKGGWTEWIKRSDVIVNLAGESIGDRRWSNIVKEEIMNSRIMITKNIVAAMLEIEEKNPLLINASGVGYYGDRGDKELTEKDEPGDDFLSSVCVRSEQEALSLQKRGNNRVVILRIGMVLSKNGGVLQKLLPLFKAGLGASFGSGRQWVSWISLKDLIMAILFIMDRDDIHGIVNCVSPNPVKFKEFSKSLGRAVRRPVFFTLPSPLLKALFGERAQIFLSSTRVVPDILLDKGFIFGYPQIETALSSIMKG